MISKPEPVICSCYIGQRKPCFDRSINHKMDLQYQSCTFVNGTTLIFQSIGFGVRTHGRSGDNQNFWDQWVTRFSRVWDSARASSACRSSAMKKVGVNKRQFINFSFLIYYVMFVRPYVVFICLVSVVFNYFLILFCGIRSPQFNWVMPSRCETKRA